MSVEAIDIDRLEQLRAERRRQRLAAFVTGNRVAAPELLGTFIHNARVIGDEDDLFESHIVIGEFDQETLLDLGLVDGVPAAGFRRPSRALPLVSEFGRTIVEAGRIEPWDPLSGDTPRADITSILAIVS